MALMIYQHLCLFDSPVELQYVYLNDDKVVCKIRDNFNRIFNRTYRQNRKDQELQQKISNEMEMIYQHYLEIRVKTLLPEVIQNELRV